MQLYVPAQGRHVAPSLEAALLFLGCCDAGRAARAAAQNDGANGSLRMPCRCTPGAALDAMEGYADQEADGRWRCILMDTDELTGSRSVHGQIARVLGVTRARVHQLERVAIGKLRAELDRRGLDASDLLRDAPELGQAMRRVGGAE